MIQSTSSSNGPIRPEAVSLSGGKSAQIPARVSDDDALSTNSAATLQKALAASPEVRPEAVSRARELAVDANYPPRAIIEQLAQLLVNAPDLSEQA